MEVIRFAENHSNRETGRTFQIDESMVRRWVLNKSKLIEAYEEAGNPSKKLRLGGGRKPCLSTIEIELMAKIACERSQQHVSGKMITTWAKKMAVENGITDFRASRGWLDNFLRRFKLKIGKPQTTNKSTSRELKENFVEFFDFDNMQRHLREFSQQSLIARMDETPFVSALSRVDTGSDCQISTQVEDDKNRFAEKVDEASMVVPYVLIPDKKIKKELTFIPETIEVTTPDCMIDRKM